MKIYRRPRTHLQPWLINFGACVLFFVPSPTSQEPLKEALILGGLTLATIVVGVLLIPRARRATI